MSADVYYIIECLLYTWRKVNQIYPFTANLPNIIDTIGISAAIISENLLETNIFLIT